jgi:hypothetical protein
MNVHRLENGKVVFDRNKRCFFLHNDKFPAEDPVRFWPGDMKKLVKLLRSAQPRARFEQIESEDAYFKYIEDPEGIDKRYISFDIVVVFVVLIYCC